MALHLIKLAVGIEDPDHLGRVQAARRQAHGSVFHLTRAMPRRAAELLDGGSIYWVIKGMISLRQRLAAIDEDGDGEGQRRCRLVLDEMLVAVERRPCRAFQGWRYLTPTEAPPDRAAGDAEPPPEMAAELRRLGLW